MDSSPAAVTRRLWPLLVSVHEALRAGVAVSAAVHAAHGWNPTADRHLDHQLVRREAMERLRPWGADLDDAGSDPLLEQQLRPTDVDTDNLGLPMSGLILRTSRDVVRIWHSDDGELPSADTHGLRDFYRQEPSAQTQLAFGDVPGRARPARCHVALLWADSRAALTRLELVRPYGHVGRRVQVDWRIDLHGRLPAADPTPAT
ncbi:hypothetical protein SAMN05661080_00259 [Modestobacter sp. DSM 44400]|uniref:hypothetical protein n=1 Tax=Modestobacter sp. DSM 44400 TaxID=1550230 RepID=UPI0008952BB1|nr:hypothetical protein [Modestobacter sp. DSM 44400]SDX51295.1 hypothetical protein SAMN05661080_00259 [Modestobacter sp. DSM 44400]